MQTECSTSDLCMLAHFQCHDLVHISQKKKPGTKQTASLIRPTEEAFSTTYQHPQLILPSKHSGCATLRMAMASPCQSLSSPTFGVLDETFKADVGAIPGCDG